MTDWDKLTRRTMDLNAGKMGAASRHAIAWAFVFALHDIADALRSLRGSA